MFTNKYVFETKYLCKPIKNIEDKIMKGTKIQNYSNCREWEFVEHLPPLFRNSARQKPLKKIAVKEKKKGKRILKNSGICFEPEELKLINLATEYKKEIPLSRYEKAKEIQNLTRSKEIQLKSAEMTKENINKIENIANDDDLFISPRSCGFFDENQEIDNTLFISQSKSNNRSTIQLGDPKITFESLKDQVTLYSKENDENKGSMKLSCFSINGKGEEAKKNMSKGMRRIRKLCTFYSVDEDKRSMRNLTVVDNIEKTHTFAEMSKQFGNEDPRITHVIDRLYIKKNMNM